MIVTIPIILEAFRDARTGRIHYYGTVLNLHRYMHEQKATGAKAAYHHSHTPRIFELIRIWNLVDHVGKSRNLVGKKL